MTKRWMLAVLITFLLVFPLHSRAEDGSVERAKQVETAWLSLIDSARYEESWRTAASVFQSAVTATDWGKAAQSARDPLGPLIARMLDSATFTHTLPSAPDGSYVVARYKTSFEHKQAAIETVTAKLEQDGSWKVCGYFVR